MMMVIMARRSQRKGGSLAAAVVAHAFALLSTQPASSRDRLEKRRKGAVGWSCRALRRLQTVWLSERFIPLYTYASSVRAR